MKTIKVVELFAGVGGFHVGLKKANNKDVKYETVWSSQWEPNSKTQHASRISELIFKDKEHSCRDIVDVVDKDFIEIKKHKHDLLVGGFPCQDYSVARTANQAKGLKGKKGVLWWSIYDILKKSGKDAPRFLMLENVDRLLKSPTKQRGRDFAVMLATLSSLGYVVEWRVINAAEYGFPQRRRRVFIMGYKSGTKPHKLARKIDPEDFLQKEGVIAKGFSVQQDDTPCDEFELDHALIKISRNLSKTELESAIIRVSKNFSKDEPKISPFYNAGLMIDGTVYTKKVTVKYSGKHTILDDVIEHDEKEVPEEFFIDKRDIERWDYLKGGKSEKRKTKDGFEYNYSEGSMIFPDALDNASRTIVTGEGGSSPSRFKHVIKTKSGRLRRLMPVELERLNMFPDDHTKLMCTPDGEVTEVSDTKRAFIMGNALVVGVITKLGKSLGKFI